MYVSSRVCQLHKGVKCYRYNALLYKGRICAFTLVLFISKDFFTPYKFG